MNKPLATVELSLATPPVTKRQRLKRFANVIRCGPRVLLHLFINLEYRDAGEWKYLAQSWSARADPDRDPHSRARHLPCVFATRGRPGSRLEWVTGTAYYDKEP